MKVLSAQALSKFREHGYHAPIRALPEADAAGLRQRLEAHELAHGPMKGALNHKSHLLFTWLDELIRHPAALDAVEDILGPNILVWGSSFFIKEPRDPSFVSWHQDSTYWGLEPPEIVTAWIALTESTAENGALRVIPGSHLLTSFRIGTLFPPTTCFRAAKKSRSRSTKGRRGCSNCSPGKCRSTMCG